MDEQVLIREKIKTHLLQTKKRNPRFSLRSLAKSLGVPASNLSSFMSAKRQFSMKTLEAITKKMILNPEERKDVLNRANALMIEKLKKSKSSTSHYSSQTLTEEDCLELNQWYYYALRSLMTLPQFKSDSEWIAAQLGLTTHQVDLAIKKMLKLKLIQVNNDGSITKTSKHLKTPDTTIKNPEVRKVLRKIHEQSIQHTIHSLHHDDVSKRDITWVNIPTNSLKIEKARELIRKFQDDMLALLEDDSEDSVYRLTVQFCPVAPRSR